ncbi:hypothetical protein F5Y17DRAFT_447144 [Xylariaceae sp. FL0594]|nr:hypothetical protein F5Y17DRAFT_447144 [Xylariaceae sp. FL0594]
MLLLQAHQFRNLKRSLLGAGVTEENIATLVLDPSGNTPQSNSYVAPTARHHREATPVEDAGPKQTASTNQAPQRTPYRAYGSTANATSARVPYSVEESRPSISEDDQGWENHDHQAWESQDHLGDNLTPSHSADGPTDVHINSFSQPRISQPALLSRTCKRTIALCGLPSYISPGDVTSVVRGGQLLDVFFRTAENTGLVSFVREEDATRFYEHARKIGIFINNKRIFVKWADHHFILGKHVANKIGGGATRNMIIRRCGAQHTEDSVREDLEHIHNLIVIKVEFVGGNCHIKTNSVHNALFARTCMMSRAKYKGSRIDWDIDECDQPFDVIQKKAPQLAPPKPSPARETRNRFDTLRLDDDDNNESDDDFDTSSE